MRAMFILIAVLFGQSATAQDWNTQVRVSGAENGSYETTGHGNSFGSNASGAYFMADFYADGVNEGARCETVEYFEVDFFFGQAATWETQVQFPMRRSEGGFSAGEPNVYFATLDRSDNVVESYWNEAAAKVAVTKIECRPDGRFDMAISFAGALVSETRGAEFTVDIVGESAATLTLTDIDQF